MKKSTVALSGVATAVLMGLSLNVQALEASSVYASAIDGSNVAANAVDNEPSTRWSAKGNDGSQWLAFNFATTPNISAVNIAFYKGNLRTTYFEIQSSDDGSNWTVELSAMSNGASTSLETFELSDAITAKYVRIVGLGNSSNTWNSITEVTFTEGEVTAPIAEEPIVETETNTSTESSGTSTGSSDDFVVTGTTHHTSADNLNETLASAVAGDEIIITDSGEISIKNISFDSPVLIRAESIGALKLENATISNSNNIILQGFLFGPSNDVSTLVKIVNSTNISILRNYFDHKDVTEGQSSLVMTESSQFIEIAFNEFHDKNISVVNGEKNTGSYIKFQYDDGKMTKNAHIHHNYFNNIAPYIAPGDTTPAGDSDREAIVMGISSSQDIVTNNIVEYNLFENTDGENEIMTIKTSENIFRHNTFKNAMGSLSFRLGHSNEAYGNYFYGTGASDSVTDDNYQTGGIRIYGENHIVRDNYMENLSGTTWRLPLLVDNGDTSDSSNGDNHQNSTGNTISNNTIVDSIGGGVYIGREGSIYKNSPSNNTITDNVVIGNDGILFGNDANDSSNVWSGNTAHATASAIATSGGALSNAELTIVSSEPSVTKPIMLTTSDVGVAATASYNAGSGDSGTVDNSDDSGTVGGSDDAGTVDNSDDSGTVGGSDDDGTVDNSDDSGTVDNSDDAGTVDSSEMTVLASGDDGKGSVAANVLDGNPNTRWSDETTSSEDAWLRLDLGTAQNIDNVQLSFHKGDKRESYFSIEISNDGQNWTTVVASTNSSGKTTGLETFEFEQASARYVRYVGEGNSASGWNSVTQFVVGTTGDSSDDSANNGSDDSSDNGSDDSANNGSDDSSDNGSDDSANNGSDDSSTNTEVTVIASGNDGKGSVAANALDGNSDTRWSAESTDGENAWLVVDLGYQQAIDNVQISFYKGDKRQSYFSVEVSNNNEDWTTVVSSTNSSGDTKALETFDFNETNARYVRYTGEGNSDGSGWNSVTQFVVGASGDYVPDTGDDETINEDGSGNGESDIEYVTIPFNHIQYQAALNAANLQQSDPDAGTKSDVVDAGEYQGYESEYFYVDSKSGWLTFEMSGNKNRTELRFEDNFKTNLSDTKYTMTAELLPINPEDSVANSSDGQEITVLQVHNKGTKGSTDSTVLSHPLLRIVWDGESRSDDETGNSYSNAYWAVIKTNAYECSDDSKDAYNSSCPDSYDNFYLGGYDANNATKFEVVVGNEELIINVDDTTKVDYDISYWAALYSYFKAGVYNQYTDGNSVVQFKSITYVESDYESDNNTDTTADNGSDDSSNNGSDDTSSALLMNSLSASAMPSDNFDLSMWNLSIPVDNGEGDGYAKATTVKVADLADYEYEDDGQHDYFWTDRSDGGMVFKDYVDGAITSKNTTYTRSELREMQRGTNTSISTQGINANNWVFSSVPSDLIKNDVNVDGNMVATLAVNHVTTTGKSSYVGRVIVGQIHAASDEPIRLYYRLLPGHTKGSIYFAHEPSNGNSEQWYELIGSRDNDADEPKDGIALNEKFSYEIDVTGDMMNVYVTKQDGTVYHEEVDMSKSGYSTGYYEKDGKDTEDYMYFKAGVYNQNKMKDKDGSSTGAEADDYVQATFYYLDVTHN